MDRTEASSDFVAGDEFVSWSQDFLIDCCAAPKSTGSRKIESNEMEKSSKRDGLVSSRLHARVCAVLIGLVGWMALWVWSFVGGAETDYLLFIVTGFIGLVVGLQLVLVRVNKTADIETRADDAPANSASEVSFRDWMRGEFEAEKGRLNAAEAALLIVLPIAAAAIGMMAFGIEFRIVEHATKM